MSLWPAVTGAGCCTFWCLNGHTGAFELRDKAENRFMGKGVFNAVANVNEVIAPEIIGYDAMDHD